MVDQITVADIAPNEMVIVPLLDRLQVFRIARVGKEIEVDNLNPRFSAEGSTNEIRTNESTSSRDQDIHLLFSIQLL